MNTKSHIARPIPEILAFAILLGAQIAAAGPANRSDRPNIVIIFTDDQGYADVGKFGAEGFTTPHLDRMADEGAVFRNFHVAQPVCSASRAALLTGCYPNRIGIHGALGPRAKFGISDRETTLAQLLKQRGYATGMMGKWHLGNAPQFMPLRHGFDEYFGESLSVDMWREHPVLISGLPAQAAAIKREYPNLPIWDGDKKFREEMSIDDLNHLTTWYTERAVKFIEKNKDRPFFLYVAHNMPHVPLGVSDKFRGKTKRGLYGDVIEEIDWSVGQILDALHRNGLDDETLVIFTSDNGPWLCYGNHAGSAKPLREGKGTNWEGGTREPCIMRWPGHIPGRHGHLGYADDHRPAADDRQARRRRVAQEQDRRHRRVADHFPSGGREEPPFVLLVLLSGQRPPSRDDRRREVEVAVAAYLRDARRPARRTRRRARALLKPQD